MIKIFKTHNNILEKRLFSISETFEIEKLKEKDNWIHLLSPTESEINLIMNSFNIPEEHIRAALDEEEKARLEIDEDMVLIIIDVPIQMSENYCSFTTVPLGILLLKDNIITVSTIELDLIDEFILGRIKSFFTFKKTRFILQILFRNATYYLSYLRRISRISETIEKKLKNNFKNEELLLLLDLEKSLVYFSTSLKSNEAVLERMMRTEIVKQYEEDLELLEDVLIETKQAIEMANIHSSILRSTRDAFSAVMSNNLNVVMKRLTSITIVFAVPTVISGFWGMNVSGVPFSESTIGFWYVIIVSILLGIIFVWALIKKDLF